MGHLGCPPSRGGKARAGTSGLMWDSGGCVQAHPVASTREMGHCVPLAGIWPAGSFLLT